MNVGSFGSISLARLVRFDNLVGSTAAIRVNPIRRSSQRFSAFPFGISRRSHSASVGILFDTVALSRFHCPVGPCWSSSILNRRAHLPSGRSYSWTVLSYFVSFGMSHRRMVGPNARAGGRSRPRGSVSNSLAFYACLNQQFGIIIQVRKIHGARCRLPIFVRSDRPP
jgi:hypothetical protein